MKSKSIKNIISIYFITQIKNVRTQLTIIIIIQNPALVHGNEISINPKK